MTAGQMTRQMKRTLRSDIAVHSEVCRPGRNRRPRAIWLLRLVLYQKSSASMLHVVTVHCSHSSRWYILCMNYLSL